MESRTLSLLASIVALLGRGATPVDGTCWIETPKKANEGDSRGSQRCEARKLAVC